MEVEIRMRGRTGLAGGAAWERNKLMISKYARYGILVVCA
jgi:hypothetical protein